MGVFSFSFSDVRKKKDFKMHLYIGVGLWQYNICLKLEENGHFPKRR